MRHLTLFFLVLCLALGGCKTVAQKRSEAISIGVHSVNKSLKANRLDLAFKYSNELIKIVPVPKKPIDIKPVIKKDSKGVTTRFVVLPPNFDLDIRPLVIDSPDFVKLTLEDPAIKKQLESDNKAAGKFEAKVDDAFRATVKDADSLPPKKFPWLGVFSGLGIVGTIALCVFVPAFIPVILTLVRTVGGFVADLFSYIMLAFRKK